MNVYSARRLELSCPLYFFGPNACEGEATLRDLSTGGCHGWSIIPVPLGLEIRLSIALPDDHKWPLVVNKARVRWQNGEEFGLEFLSMGAEQRDRLEQFLWQAKGPWK